MTIDAHESATEVYDVAIVGLGPIGSVLAILLAQSGQRVVVLERWPAPYALPRAVHFDHEVGRILQSCGIGEQLRSISEPAEIYEWRNAVGATLLRFGRIGNSISGWPESSMFNQPALEGLLQNRIAELPIDVRRGVEVTGIEQGADDAVVSGIVTDGGAGVQVRAEYVVGCDGANSTVRSLVDIRVADLGFFYDWLIVDVVLDHPRVFDPLNVQICDPVRPTTAVSGGPGRRRWEFMRLPDETRADLDSEAAAWKLLAPWDVHPANATLERHAVYTFNARHAETWRTGRVLLAGDAAHQMPPFAGQGMCSGIRDAANLAWKLALVLDGRADDALLDTYETERMPDARSAIEFSMELGKVICVADAAEAAQRDEAMSSMVGTDLAPAPSLPPIAAGVIAAGSPSAGHASLQPTIGIDGQTALFDDAAGAGWRMVTRDADALDASTSAWFDSIGGRRIDIDSDSCPAYADWFDANGCGWALQRPDFRLYGTADDADGATVLLTGLRATLQSTPNHSLAGEP